MKQIIQNYKTGQVTLENVPVPQCGRKSILVKNSHSLISIGTEKSTIELGKKSLIGKAKARPDLVKRFLEKVKNEGLQKTWQEAMGRLDTPTPLGYSAAGMVIEVGIDAHEFSPGDRVACIGQGFASHAEYISVPINLAVKLPDNVDMQSAAFGMLGCIALHGIRSANLTFGSTVAVLGLGLLGQLTIQLLKAYGCEVFAYDVNAEKIAMSQKNGAAFSHDHADTFRDAVSARTHKHGVDAVIITAATQSSEPVDFAIQLLRKKGKMVIVGVADIHPNRNELWKKEIELIVSKAAGPGSLEDQYEKKGIDYPIDVARWTEKRNLAEFIRLLEKKLITVSGLITETYSIDDAEKVYDAFLQNQLKNPIGLLFEYPCARIQHDVASRDECESSAREACEAGCRTRAYRDVFTASSRALLSHEFLRAEKYLPRKIILKPDAIKRDQINLSVIGAGLYGKAVFLPTLQKRKDIQLRTLITSSGISAQHNAKRFGFSACSTDLNDAFTEETDALIALTPHSQHASLILKSIELKKSLLIEKPLCVNQDELNEIISANQAQSEKPVIMIGHNRRFSPHTEKIKKWLVNRANPAVISYRVNAGYVPHDHWVHSDTEGRSRIVGEMTHFIDFMQCVLNENPASVFAKRIAGDDQSIVNNDNVVATITFDRGSVASLIYTAAGNRALNREYIEIFFDEKTILSTDFRVSELIAGKQSEKFKTSKQEMGYEQEIHAFLGAVTGKTQVTLADAFISAQVVFAMEESLAENRTVGIIA